MRKRGMVLLAPLVGLLVAIPVVVLAATGGGGGRADMQKFVFRTGAISTSSTSYQNVPGLSASMCAVGEVSATVSVNLAGAPGLFVVRVDSDGTIQPGGARFTPPGGGIGSFSYTFVGTLSPFEGSDGHTITLQWRSLNGQPVTMTRGDVNLIFQTGSCP
jgi:hypothetical protein